MLMPASGDAKRDREILLKILTMDDAGTLARWRTDKRFSDAELSVMASPEERERWKELAGTWEAAREDVKRLRLASKKISRSDREPKARAIAMVEAAELEADRCGATLNEFISELQDRCFQRLPYAERICAL
ncbi:MAG UNVERIFIED_CONTAM: hypothetical protein LVR18_19775 [Planctomycetaceae bacterium]|jgi:Asp-tRNA(Asn)/Glu-tRNA(Gln) amidotransferase A subunit family amidase